MSRTPRTSVPLAALALALVVAGPGPGAGRLPPVRAAEDHPPRAGDLTERGRDIDRILDMVLVPGGGASGDERVLVLLLDPTASLQKSDFGGELAAALERHARTLGSTRIGVARVGGSGGLLLKPTTRRELVVQTVQEVLAQPESAVQNVYAEVRRILPDLKRESGRREVLLVTLENGDAEDDVEQTVLELERAEVACSVIGREAFLSDAWWALHPPKSPPGTKFLGPDGAFIDLPWGFRFQWSNPNNYVLSGFAMYGLTRLAAATAGRVFLYYPPSGFLHECCHHVHCLCLFCEGDHQGTDADLYQAQRLRAVAPLALPRDEVLQRAVNDPWYRAVLRAWDDAVREGLLYARPSIEHVGGVLRLEPHPYRGWIPLGGSTAFPSEAQRAGRLIERCDGILRRLESDLREAATGPAEERWHALADTFALQLRITRMNLILYVAFCEAVGPEIARRRADTYEPPEQAPYGDDPGFRWIGFYNLSLCHGVAPFRAVRLPGGEKTAREMRALDDAFGAHAARWSHTPWAQVARNMGLARFYLVKQPGYVPPGQRRVPDTDTDATVTLPERPARPTRPGSGTSGGSAGPATGR